MTTPYYPGTGQPSPDPSGTPPSQGRGFGLKVALVGAGVAAGAITATAIGASAATTTGTSSPSGTSSTSVTDRGHHGGPMRGDEKSLSAAVTAKLKAAALKAVPSGTVNRIESDSGDAVYEAHMTRADGTEVTLKFDRSLTVTGVESGMGK